MITSRFSGIALGDETVHYLITRHRLVRRQEPLLWSNTGLVSDDSPSWVNEIRVVISVSESTIHDLNSTLAQLLDQITAAGIADLVIAQGQSETTVVTYPNCRFDELRPDRPGPYGPGKTDELFILTFTTASDPVSP